MLNIGESIAFIMLIVSGAIAFLYLLRYAWPIEQRRQHNDLIGWQVTVIGTTYAVIIGFMLYAVWTNFELADGNAEAEANSLVNVVRAAQALPAVQRMEVRNLASEYVNIMLDQEWPAMSRMSVSPASTRTIRHLWAVLWKVETHNPSEQISLDQTLSELRKMTEHRRIRELQMAAGFPAILWAVLIIGALTTIISACLFGSMNFKLHLAQVFMLSLIISLVLVAIADINRPFQGAVHVFPVGFERARATLDDLISNKD